MSESVDVPVPEELVADVMELVSFLIMAKAAAWRPDGLAAHLERSSAEAQELARLVATARARGEGVTVATAADELGISTRAVTGLVVELNHRPGLWAFPEIIRVEDGELVMTEATAEAMAAGSPA